MASRQFSRFGCSFLKFLGFAQTYTGLHYIREVRATVFLLYEPWYELQCSVVLVSIAVMITSTAHV